MSAWNWAASLKHLQSRDDSMRTDLIGPPEAALAWAGVTPRNPEHKTTPRVHSSFFSRSNRLERGVAPQRSFCFTDYFKSEEWKRISISLNAARGWHMAQTASITTQSCSVQAVPEGAIMNQWKPKAITFWLYEYISLLFSRGSIQGFAKHAFEAYIAPNWNFYIDFLFL